MAFHGDLAREAATRGSPQEQFNCISRSQIAAPNANECARILSTFGRTQSDVFGTRPMPESRVPNISANDAIDAIDINAATLVAGWPPRLVNGHKIAIARTIDDAVGPHRGAIRYVRHSAPSLPDVVALSGAADRVTIRCGAYDHVPAADGAVAIVMLGASLSVQSCSCVVLARRRMSFLRRESAA